MLNIDRNPIRNQYCFFR